MRVSAATATSGGPSVPARRSGTRGSSRSCARRSRPAGAGRRRRGTARRGGCGRGRPSRPSRPGRGGRGRGSAPRRSRRRAARPRRGESWVESWNGESFAVWRISFDQARPMPAIARWSRRSGCSRCGSRARISPSRSAPSPSASGPRLASFSSAASGVRSQTPARFFEPPSVRISRPPPSKRTWKAGTFGPFSPEAEVAQPPRAHQVDEQDELAVLGREAEPLAAPLGPGEAPAFERAQRRVDRLQRRDVSRAGLLDREGADRVVQAAAPRLDLG